MRRVNDRTVVLNKHEQQAVEIRDELQAEGFDTVASSRAALIAMDRHHRTHRFAEYLSDGTLTLHHGVIVPKVR